MRGVPGRVQLRPGALRSRRGAAIGTVGAWIRAGVACFSSAIARVIASLRRKPSKEVNEELSVCALMRPSLDASRPAVQ
jgi:hypothetical protein